MQSAGPGVEERLSKVISCGNQALLHLIQKLVQAARDDLLDIKRSKLASQIAQ